MVCVRMYVCYFMQLLYQFVKEGFTNKVEFEQKCDGREKRAKKDYLRQKN